MNSPHSDVIDMASLPEIRHLRYFLAVADHLHFGRAAQALGIAQPPLSQQIRSLEKRLGYALFFRTTRGVQVTEAGSFLQARAKLLLEHLKVDLKTALRIAMGLEGKVVIGFSGSIMFSRLPLTIERFRSEYPNVELHLREMATGEQEQALAERSLDIAVMRDGTAPVGHTLERLDREPFVAILAETHHLAHLAAVKPFQLAQEGLILYERSKGKLAFNRTMACFGKEEQPLIVQNTPQWPTAISLVAAGLGFSIAPASVAKLALPGVVFRPLRTRERSHIDLVFAAGVQSGAVKAFLEGVRTTFHDRDER